MRGSGMLSGRLLVVAFEGWNDAGEAASGAVRSLKEQLDVYPISEIDAERYFDFQFNRPMVSIDDDGHKQLTWPNVTVYGPTALKVQQDRAAAEALEGQDEGDELDGIGDNSSNIYLLLGTEPSRNWRSFTAELMETITETGITGIVMLGAMLADVPHTRPISVFVGSENADLRAELSVERSTYEGPVGILSVLGDAAEKAGIPTVSIWASVPHYVHNAPSPKATLAIIDKLEEIIDVVIPRGDLVEESAAWESGIDALAADDDDMASYISQLEQARDTVDSPEASGEAIAQEFERYLRRRDGKAGGKDQGGPTGPPGSDDWRPKE
ncbi:PAC2 family protein [Lacisediminihabitans changchengi]|uniref:PAC2 family protein n=1 Tax=Lacisediminihabitans changchengi TaxID=2787634 RepID=A0A934W3B3_9MICO|nr:PAC2 family protein [Lacisediminihabitans changchengi]MBK4347029.1 PAC2 family protein [Lacisediminihabitans changchengi]MBK4347848.1 PAC2 family protein [Lacisediminihabitans changchengi]